MSLFLLIFTYAAWSSVFSLGKMALINSTPIFLTSFRMLFAGIILLTWLFFKNKSSLKIGKNQIIPLIALAIFSIYLTNILEFWGLQYLTAAKTCFFYSISPFFAAIFSYIHFGEKINAKKLLGMLIGFIGFTPVLISSSGEENFLKAFSIFSWPELAILGAALFSVYGWVLLRIIVKKQTISPLYANGYSMLFGGLMALIHSVFMDQWNPIPVSTGFFFPFFKGVIMMTLISNVLCYNLYGYMLKKFTATFVSFMGLLSPIFASINSWILLGEPPSGIVLLSTGIVSLGLFIVYQAELKQGYFLKKPKQTPIDPQEV